MQSLRAVVGMTIPEHVGKDTKKELEKVRAEAKRLADVLDGRPRECYGERCHVLLADLVITLECPPGIPVVTSNVRHFAPLCSALSRPEPLGYR
ncbi:hypothetical protein FJY63_01885 [Candidatus Sumerlaeota bacterium]|nr:hypothetical protein [Candidatus Sumerlaeota bacterium]